MEKRPRKIKYHDFESFNTKTLLDDWINKDHIIDLHKTLKQKEDQSHRTQQAQVMERAIKEAIDHKMFRLLDEKEIQSLIVEDLLLHATLQQNLVECIQGKDRKKAIDLYEQNTGCTHTYARNMVDHMFDLPAHQLIQIFAQTTQD